MLKIKKRTLILISAGAGVCGAIAIIILSTWGIKAETVTALRGNIADVYVEEGVVRSGQEYYHLSKVSGPVKSVEVSENMAVRQGNVLLTVDDRDLRYEKELHESALTGYQAQLDQSSINQLMSTSPEEYLDAARQEMLSGEALYQAAKTVAQGTRVLYDTGSVSKVEWEQVQAEYKAAESGYLRAKNRYEESLQYLESLKAEGIDKELLNTRFYDSTHSQLSALIETERITIAQIESQIDDCIMKAECDGVVMTVPSKDLSSIQAGQVAVVINRNQELVIEANVLTSVEPYLKVGDPVVLVQKLRNQDIKFTGTIAKIFDFAEKGTSALGLDEYRVKVEIALDENQDNQMKTGYSVNVQFILYQSDGQLLIPAQAVFKADDQDCVFLVRSGRAVKTPVTVAYKSAIQAVIMDGIAEGDHVISNIDVEGIYDGAKVHK